MRLTRVMQRTLPFAAIALLAAAPVAFAQGQQLFEWNGRVDREVQISMRGDRVWTNDLGNSEAGRVRVRTMGSMPRADGQVVVQVQNGRGQVDVIQQPNSGNGFTTVVRLRDPQGGSAPYRVVAYWQPNEVRGREREGGLRGELRNRNMLHWSGNVDGEIELRIKNGSITTRTLSGNQPTNIRSEMGNAGAPANGTTVGVIQNSGRGSVTITQQPSAFNGYTTVVRIRDPQGGYGFYDFNLAWQ